MDYYTGPYLNVNNGGGYSQCVCVCACAGDGGDCVKWGGIMVT